jgi:hypothetical protein
MSILHSHFLKWASWASLVAPFIAYVLCSEVSTGHLFIHAPPYGQNVGLLVLCAFLVSAMVGVFVLLADVGFKRWRFFWLPLAGLILTYLLFVKALWFTRFLD